MTPLERLVSVVAAQYRWGLHPLKLVVALLLPVVLVWIADLRVRRQAALLEEEEARLRRLPRMRRR